MISVIVRSHPIVITIHQLKPRQRLTDAPPAPKVMSGKRFRVQPPRVQPEILNIALAVGHWAAATGHGCAHDCRMHAVGTLGAGLRDLAYLARSSICGFQLLSSSLMGASIHFGSQWQHLRLGPGHVIGCTGPLDRSLRLDT